MFWRLDGFSREGALPTLKYLKELRDHVVDYKYFTEPCLDSLGPFGDVIVSKLVTIAAQDLVKISQNTKAALAEGRWRKAGRTNENGSGGGAGLGLERGREAERLHCPHPQDIPSTVENYIF